MVKDTGSEKYRIFNYGKFAIIKIRMPSFLRRLRVASEHLMISLFYQRQRFFSI